MEIRNARPEKKHTYTEMNSLVDRRMIEKLYSAAQVGVRSEWL
jgi:polyphosphate kinase